MRKVKTLRKRLANTFKGNKEIKGIKGIKTDDAQLEEDLHKECNRGYCNKDCKDTIYQDGPMPPAVIKSFKGTKERKAVFKTMIETLRTGIFGKKKSVLNDSFYEGLPEKDVKRLKKEGATSACTLIAL